MAKFQNVLAVVKGIFAVAVMLFVASCDKSDNLFEYQPQTQHDTTVVVTPPDTVVKNDTIVISNEWKVVTKVVNYGDSISVTTNMENPAGEKHNLPGYVVFYPKKDNYEIFENQELLSPKFANDGRTGGRTTREEETSEGWWDVRRFFFPTEDGNILVAESHMFHIPNLPYVRVSESEILSLEDPSMRTRALYKVKDAPIEASDLVSFEAVSFANDSLFTEELTCNFNRFLMAEDDIASKKAIMQGTDTIDAQTLQDSVKVQITMKSGEKHETVDYIVRKSDYANRTFTADYVNDFSGYGFGRVIGISNLEAEKKIDARSVGNWTLYQKKDVYSAVIAGEKSFNTEYYIQSERTQYKDEKWGIEVNFGYPNIRVEEGATTLNTVASDKSGYDKAVVTNNVSVKLGRFSTPLSEVKPLYKEAKVERVVVEKGWDRSKTKEVWTPTTHMCQGTYYWLWNDGVRDEKVYEWTVSRLLTPGDAFDRICKDNSNRTGKPSILDLKSTPKNKKDQDATWSGSEDKATIGTNVEFNGAEKADVLFYSTEVNDIKCQVGDDVLEFGHDAYDFTLSPALGTGSVKGDYTVYPYTAVLSYTFGDSEAKTATDKGTIRVAVPEEETFFPKPWGKLQYVEQTTTISENQKKWDYVWSLHFYNEETKEYRVLPVILAYATPDVPKWDFNLVEKCEKRAYELYNSAFYMPDGIKNAWAEDNREHMQWSIAVEGTDKMAYGSMRYRTAEDKAWDWESAVNGHATVKTHRYELTVTDGRLFAKDTYNNTKITDSHCVNGGWK